MRPSGRKTAPTGIPARLAALEARVAQIEAALLTPEEPEIPKAPLLYGGPEANASVTPGVRDAAANP